MLKKFCVNASRLIRRLNYSANPRLIKILMSLKKSSKIKKFKNFTLKLYKIKYLYIYKWLNNKLNII